MDNDHQRRWYVAVVVVRARIDDEWHDDYWLAFFDQDAPSDAESAHRRALELGKAAEHSYENGDGATVRWEFVGLADLDEIQAGAIDDGVEVYSWRARGHPEEAVVPKDKLGFSRGILVSDPDGHNVLLIDRR